MLVQEQPLCCIPQCMPGGSLWKMANSTALITPCSVSCCPDCVIQCHARHCKPGNLEQAPKISLIPQWPGLLYDNSRENEGQAFLLSQLQDFITITGTTTTTGNNNWHYNLCPVPTCKVCTCHVTCGQVLAIGQTSSTFIGHAAKFKFESMCFGPCQSSGNHFQRLCGIQKTIKTINWTAKSMAELLELGFGSAWGGRTG